MIDMHKIIITVTDQEYAKLQAERGDLAMSTHLRKKLGLPKLTPGPRGPRKKG